MGGMRKIAAILVADIVGYSRLAGTDEDRTLSRLRGLRSDLIDPAIDAHHGRIVKRTGDGSIIEFRSVVDAVRCAIEVQNGMIERNAGLPPEWSPNRAPRSPPLHYATGLSSSKSFFGARKVAQAYRAIKPI
jgi:class 3 adenylate cyclase